MTEIWTEMKVVATQTEVCLLKAKEIIQMLKQVQHDIMVWFCSFCHSEPCRESSNVTLNVFGECLLCTMLGPGQVGRRGNLVIGICF